MTLSELQTKLDRSPFIKFLRMRAESIDSEQDRVVISMPLRPELERSGGTKQYHGGAIASLIDVAGDFALVLGVGAGVPTINFRVDYLRPATGEILTATAWVRRAGRTIGVVDIDVHDKAGRLVAVGRGCYSTQPG